VPDVIEDGSRPTPPPSGGSYDAIVVGAGAIGLACAWRVAQRGLEVCVVERHRPGAGASSVAAGMLAPVGEVSWGQERLLALNLASARLYPDFALQLAAASGRTVPYRRCGGLEVALDRDEAAELHRRFELHVSLGLDSEWLTPAQCRRLEPSLAPQVGPGLHAPHEAEVDPRALVSALAGACERAGVRTICGEEVAELLVEDGAVAGVRTAAGTELAAPSVVAAAGCWSGEAAWLPPASRPPVRPVKGEVVRLRAPAGAGPGPNERLVGSERVYVVPRASGEVVLGATVEELGFDTTVSAGGVHELLREAYRVVPGVAELEFVEAIAGLRPGTPDNAPIVGPVDPAGLVLATGHYRNGILLAPITADSVSALLLGDEPPEALDGVGPERFDEVGAR